MAPKEQSEASFFCREIGFFYSFLDFERKSLSLLAKIPQEDCHNYILGVHGTIFSKNQFEIFYLFYIIFVILCEKISASCRTILIGVVKAAFYVSKETFSGGLVHIKKSESFFIFSINEQYFLGFCQKK